MIKPSLMDAIDTVEMTYQELSEIANDMIKEIIQPINSLINEITYKIETLSIEDVRQYMLRLAVNAYTLSETRERAGLKAECAEAIRKEAYAKKYSEASGSNNTARDGYALLETSEQTITEALYSLIGNLLKAKVDHANRVVDCLKSILMSRMQEAKMEINAAL